MDFFKTFTSFRHFELIVLIDEYFIIDTFYLFLFLEIMPEVLTLSGLADAEPDLSTFENKTGLAEDMKFLASMPELCDVTFLVGDTREPVCAVKVKQN